jgi:hypothetical protein
MAAAGLAGCAGNAKETSTPFQTVGETESPTSTASPTATSTPFNPTPEMAYEDFGEPMSALEKTIELQPPFPETDSAIASYREDLVSERFDMIGNPQETDEPIRISSLEELVEYAPQNDVYVKMEPGTYEITLDNFGEFITRVELWNDAFGLGAPNRAKANTFLPFSCVNSYFDLRDVHITLETRIFDEFPGPLDISRNNTLIPVEVPGFNNVIEGLTVEWVHDEEWETEYRTYPTRSAVVVATQGNDNLIKDCEFISRGSQPYGYGRILGKGRDCPVSIFKHKVATMAGWNTLYVGTDFISRSYSHIISSMRGKSIYIDCNVEGEVRSTNDMLEEETGPLADNDYKNCYGNTVQKGMIRSLQEGVWRTYHSNLPTAIRVHNCTVKKGDAGSGWGHDHDANAFISNTTYEKQTNRHIAPSSGDRFVNCRADMRYCPAVSISVGGGSDPNNCEVDVTVLPSPTPDLLRYQAYPNSGYDHIGSGDRGPYERGPFPFAAAMICGTKNQITLRKAQDDLKVEEPHPLIIGSHNWSSGGATNCTVENHLDQKVVLLESASNCTVRTNGPVDDRGQSNTIEELDT